MTVRARELLADADGVLHDALIPSETVALGGPQAILEPVGKRGGADGTAQERITARMIELARSGHFAVRLKGGDPFVFGRGGEELRELVEAGIDVVVVPGVSSAVAAAASIGVPVTLRGVASSVAITTGTGTHWQRRIRDLARGSATLVALSGRTTHAEAAAQGVTPVAAPRRR